ncbi:MAG: alpha/beta hydrolase [Candidatus Eremiobacteraeota bacterium]|nr:alpha/beta hydrolase [Candidatus Eremiobacteraeota bacterium]
MRAFRCILTALLVLAVVPSAAVRAESESLGLHLAPCSQGRSKVPAECGTFGVYEDRVARSGRIISLRLVILKAKHPTHHAIAFIPGGPGQSAVSLVPIIADGLFAKSLSALRDRYDILFVDSRGMGGSHAFDCNLVPAAHPGSYFRQLWPDALLSACRVNTAARSNPSLYNTNNAVDDFDDVRAALGYPKLVLGGGSYGTFFALVDIRRHPEHVESAILNGVVAPHFVPLPGSPDGAQTALNDLIAKCRRDAVCNAHFPAFAQHFDVLVQRFDHGPILVRVKNEATKRFETVPLSKEVFVDRLRNTLYDPQNAASIPYVVERAYHADYVPLGDLVNGMSLLMSKAVNYGAFLSYTCADEIPFVSEEALKAAANHSFAGDLRVRAQQHACSIWNVRPMPPNFNDPVRSDVPILIVTGSDDPTTPPHYASEALPYLRNAKQVLVRGAGHTTEIPCTERLIEQFVRAGSAKGLDVSRCDAAFKTPPFATSMAGQ